MSSLSLPRINFSTVTAAIQTMLRRPLPVSLWGELTKRLVASHLAALIGECRPEATFGNVQVRTYSCGSFCLPNNIWRRVQERSPW
mmetsp:Transcript_22151/g.61557  ORF Transcript_22151/g.61557 Transcript_22151/m.61557 type:complete len:86 (-) Transcript_22151:754-1011(-)